MPSYRAYPPVIRWGTNYTTVLSAGYPLDNVKTGEEPREGSTWVQAPSGVEDAWIVGTDYVLEGDLAYIPQTDVAIPHATGWDGTAGVRAFLTWARQKNALRFHPDGRNLVLWPLMTVDGDSDGVVDAFSNNAPGFGTRALDSGAQRIDVPGAGNTTGGLAFPGVYQTLGSVLQGETLTVSVEYKTSGLANGTLPSIAFHFIDSTGAIISPPGTTLTASATFARNAFTATAPAGTVLANVLLMLQVPANTGTLSAGTVWYRSAMVRRESTDAAFIDNPSILCTLADPMQGLPESEQDGTRRLKIRLRNSSTPFDGY